MALVCVSLVEGDGGGGGTWGDMAITGGGGGSTYTGNQLIKLAKLECVVVAF